MLFNSFQFVIFFPIVVGLYFLTPQRFRWCLLLIASYYFYSCWKPEYLILIAVSTLVDYGAGLQMGRTGRPGRKQLFLIVSLVSNLSILFAFKYFNFFSASTRALLNQFNLVYNTPHLDVLLPVGISFYTFQTLSYTINVYRGVHPPERHLGIFALYVSFFPQLVAGPIERSDRLLPQFFQPHRFEYDRVTQGVKVMLWGFFKKMVIADRIAVLVDPVYASPAEWPGLSLVLATVLFAFQIYCDFSGYSDIAIGSAKVMGYELQQNFNRPYRAISIADFWRRWHISLSTWFRDYLYFPIGGSRVGRSRWRLNIMVVFLVSGLWHGANWTYLVWGGVHGAYIVLGNLIGPPVKRLATRAVAFAPPVPAGTETLLRVAGTFALVCVAWIFFRAESLDSAWFIVTHLGCDHPPVDWIHGRTLGRPILEVYIMAGAIAFMEWVHAAQGGETFEGFNRRLNRKPAWLRGMFYGTLILALIVLTPDTHEEFIYFQF